MKTPKQDEVVDYVRRNPGLPLRNAARYVGSSQRFGYETVHRAIKNGKVRTEKGPRNSVLLFPIGE